MNLSMLNQARELKSKLDKAQKELGKTIVEAESGKGAVISVILPNCFFISSRFHPSIGMPRASPIAQPIRVAMNFSFVLLLMLLYLEYCSITSFVVVNLAPTLVISLRACLVASGATPLIASSTT